MDWVKTYLQKLNLRWMINEHYCHQCHVTPSNYRLHFPETIQKNGLRYLSYGYDQTFKAKQTNTTYSALVSVKMLTLLCVQWRWDVPIHVDAASGGFIAPFLYPELEWDFRLPLVKSINVSGHKYGLVYAGVGWVIWRCKEDLPEELIFHINYLGTDQPTFTLNFSKGIFHSVFSGSCHFFGLPHVAGNWVLGNFLQVLVRSLRNTINSFA